MIKQATDLQDAQDLTVILHARLLAFAVLGVSGICTGRWLHPVPTAWRTLNEIADAGPRALSGITAAVKRPAQGVGGYRGPPRRSPRRLDRGPLFWRGSGVLDDGIVAIPPKYQRPMVTADGLALARG